MPVAWGIIDSIALCCRGRAYCQNLRRELRHSPSAVLVRHPWTVPPSVAYILAIRDSISEVASPQSIRRERTHVHRMSSFGTRRRHRAIRNHLTLRSRPSIRNAISDVVTIVLDGESRQRKPAMSGQCPCALTFSVPARINALRNVMLAIIRIISHGGEE